MNHHRDFAPRLTLVVAGLGLALFSACGADTLGSFNDAGAGGMPAGGGSSESGGSGGVPQLAGGRAGSGGAGMPSGGASAAGSDAGGAAGAASAGGGERDIGPTSCLSIFEEACTPEIVFHNDEPEGRGAIFDQVIPDAVATMKDVACTVCSILFRDPEEIPENKRHTTINLTLEEHFAVASASGNSITVDLDHVANYDDPEEALTEFRGVLVHETVHLYQHYGNGGLGEGMADFVRIRVGLYEPGRRNPGGSWTDPYTTSGFFFSWLAGPGLYHDDGREPHDVDIGYLINRRIGEQGPDGVPSLFEEVFDSDVETLWNEYQDAID